MKRGGSWVRRTLSAKSLLNILGGALAPRDRSPPRKRHRTFESARSQSSVASLPVVEAAATPVAGAGPFATAGASSLVVRAVLALALALLAVSAALALASDAGPRASTLLPHGVRATAETWAMKFQWDAAALASSWRALPAAVANDATNRDEYGLLTLDAQCAALRERGRDPRWPLRDPSTIVDDGLDGLGFASAAQLCDAMASLPRTLRVYTHPLGDEEKRRYAAARVAPTFNRGYDVEEHVVTNLGPAGPFAEADPAKANAFLIPARPYLERVAAFPNSGRDAQVANTAKLVARVKREDAVAWRVANPGCGRIFVSAHDTGASAARLTDDAVRDRAVFIVSNADVTSDAERDAAVAAWASKSDGHGRDEGTYVRARRIATRSRGWTRAKTCPRCARCRITSRAMRWRSARCVRCSSTMTAGTGTGTGRESRHRTGTRGRSRCRSAAPFAAGFESASSATTSPARSTWKNCGGTCDRTGRCRPASTCR